VTTPPLAAYIRAKRGDAGLSQEELARRIAHSQPAVSAWESGQSTPGAKAIAALARELPDARVDEMLALITEAVA